MKRILGVLGIFIIVMSAISPFAVKADVLWEPMTDFFAENGVPTTIERRTYVINSPQGFVNVYKSPDSAATTRQILNGDTFYVYYKGTYNGKLWGLNTEEEYICLENTYVLYDHISFAEAYSEKFEQLSQVTVELKKGYIYRSYPGDASYNTLGFDCPEAYPTYSFIDENGLKWMYFGYVYGLRNFWVCMDDPYSTELAVREVPSEAKIYAAATPESDTIKVVAKQDTGTTLAISNKGIYIVIACICTFILALVCGFLVLRKTSDEQA